MNESMPAAVTRLVSQARRGEGTVTPRRERPRCGAKTRKGAPCQMPAVWDHKRDRPRNGRCKLHGGLSTGARTAEGKARAREPILRLNAQRRAARAKERTT